MVEVNHQMGTNFKFYRVGQAMEGGIKWWTPSPEGPPRKKYYGSGAYPRVSLNDDNTVVEVHKGQYLDRCFYRVGKVDFTKRKISWGSSMYFSIGLYPDVAVNNKNTIVAIFLDNLFTKHLNYRVGQISRVKKEIIWTKGKQRVRAIGEEKIGAIGERFSFDINDNGLVVLSHQNPFNYHIHYKVGMINDYSGVIDWRMSVHKCMGFTPSISINDCDQVLHVHQSMIRRHLVSNVGVARWNENFQGVDWSTEEGGVEYHYGKGLYPSVAWNASGQVVEVHEPRVAPTRNRLHYYVGKLIN